jgi:hypothetical protein
MADRISQGMMEEIEQELDIQNQTDETVPCTLKPDTLRAVYSTILDLRSEIARLTTLAEDRRAAIVKLVEDGAADFGVPALVVASWQSALAAYDAVPADHRHRPS